MQTQLEEMLDRIAEIIRRVGKRDEVEDLVAENIDFASLANSLLTEAGPVREAAVTAITKMLSSLEIESGGDIEAAILEAIDFTPIVASLSGDPQIVEALKGVVKSTIEDTDEENLGGIVDEAFGLNNSEDLIKTLGNEAQAELKRIVADKVRQMIEDWDPDSLDDDTKSEIELAVFSKERVAAYLVDLDEGTRTAIAKFVSDMVENSNPDDSDDNLTQLVFESSAIKLAIEAATQNLNRTGRLDRLVEDAVTKMLTDDDSEFRSGIEEKVSEKLTQMIGTMTESVVTRLFEARR